MTFKRNDWVVIQDAEENGNVASMTCIVSYKRTENNKKLSDYFKNVLPEYHGVWDGSESEDILDGLNTYLDEKWNKKYWETFKVDRSARNVNLIINKNLEKRGNPNYYFEFPMNETNVHLLQITDNLQLKIIIADEYYGSGDYSKYIQADFFVIDENTTEKDVDCLIEFIREYLL